MNLYTRAGFSDFVTGLPAVCLAEQWESVVAKVGGKVFALVALDESGVTFKVSETSFEGLTAADGIGQAPYFAKRQWVAVEAGRLDEAALAAYLREAHRLIVKKLTRKAQAELGIAELVAAGPRRG